MSQQKTKVEKDTSERWLLTYADLMNLLLILFIILFAMSSVSQAKFDQLASSLKAAFGESSAASFYTPGGNSLTPLPNSAPSPVIPAQTEKQQMDAVKEKVKDLVEKGGLEGKVDVKMEERGIVISITAQLLFKPGSADLEMNSKPTIEDIGRVLKEIPGNHIRVEGHTDSDPIRNARFDSNWELSSARATNVVRLLIDRAGIVPTVISATGYGETKPVAPNDTTEHKAMNRRVNIVILKSMYDKAEPEVQSESDAADSEGNTEEAGTEGAN